MSIRLIFRDALDSPTGNAVVRLRWSAQRDAQGRQQIHLLYGHGTRELTAQAWAGYRMAGATLEGDDARDEAMIAAALGVDSPNKSE